MEVQCSSKVLWSFHFVDHRGGGVRAACSTLNCNRVKVQYENERNVNVVMCYLLKSFPFFLANTHRGQKVSQFHLSFTLQTLAGTVSNNCLGFQFLSNPKSQKVFTRYDNIFCDSLYILSHRECVKKRKWIKGRVGDWA